MKEREWESAMSWKLSFSGGLFLGLLFFLSGCMSFTTLQTAETLQPGSVQLGAGTMVSESGGDWVALPEVSGRLGVVNDLDVGVKYSPPDVVMLDGKYRFLNNGIEGAFDFGWSTNTGHNEAVKLHGYYPMLLIGQKHWYAGVKGLFFTTTGEISL